MKTAWFFFGGGDNRFVFVSLVAVTTALAFSYYGGGDNRLVFLAAVTTALFMLVSFWSPHQPWKAAKGKKGKATKAAAKAKAKCKRSADAKARHRNGGKPKLASWLKARPNGCGKCRYIPGCTKSCYLVRGEKVPK